MHHRGGPAQDDTEAMKVGAPQRGQAQDRAEAAPQTGQAQDHTEAIKADAPQRGSSPGPYRGYKSRCITKGVQHKILHIFEVFYPPLSKTKLLF